MLGCVCLSVRLPASLLEDGRSHISETWWAVVTLSVKYQVYVC